MDAMRKRNVGDAVLFHAEAPARHRPSCCHIKLIVWQLDLLSGLALKIIAGDVGSRELRDLGSRACKIYAGDTEDVLGGQHAAAEVAQHFKRFVRQ